MSKIIYVDLDEVLADFSGSEALKKGNKVYGPPEMYVPDFFLDLKPVKGAHQIIYQLIQDGFDVQILTQPVANSPISYTEKAQWVLKHFPVLGGKINMSQDKGNFVGAYLIDDNTKWKEPFEKNGGKFLHFNLIYSSGYMWKDIYEMILNHEQEKKENALKIQNAIFENAGIYK